MDANKTLQLIQDADNISEIDEHCHSLREWLIKDGFDPYWMKFPLGRQRYNSWLRSHKLSIHGEFNG